MGSSGEGKLAGFDARQVEHFVDEGEQVAAALENLVNALPLLGMEPDPIFPEAGRSQ